MKRIFTPVNKKYLALFVAFILSIGLLAIFGDKGLIEAYQLKQERDSIYADIINLKESNKALEDDIHLLNNDKRYIERLARKELGMVKKGEVIYIFK